MNKTIARYGALLALALVLAAQPGVAGDDPGLGLPWLESIGASGRLEGLHTVSAKADVTVSDGLTYSVTTLFHDRQRAIFRRVYQDRTVTQGVEGRFVWSFDGQEQTEAQPFVEEIVIGHQLHAQILFFDRLHPGAVAAEQATFGGRECMKVQSTVTDGSWSLFFEPSGMPLGLERSRTGEAPIVFTFDDWRSVEGILLPFSIAIDDGQRQFDYRFSSVRLNEGHLDELRPPESLMTGEQKLLRLHRIIMDDHLFGRTQQMTRNQGDSMTIVSDGEVYTVSSDEAGAMLERIMASRDYFVYDDLIRPLVSISEDGTSGWLIAQVAGEGIHYDEDRKPAGPLEFVSSWVELYEKVEGEWRRHGIASTFRPGRK
jgi:hypothetical protein